MKKHPIQENSTGRRERDRARKSQLRLAAKQQGLVPLTLYLSPAQVTGVKHLLAKNGYEDLWELTKRRFSFPAKIRRKKLSPPKPPMPTARVGAEQFEMFDPTQVSKQADVAVVIASGLCPGDVSTHHRRLPAADQVSPALAE